MASKNLKNLFWLCLFSATLTAVPCKVAAKSAALLVGIKIPGEDNEYVDMGKKISHLFFDFDSEDGKVKLSRNGQTLEAIFDIVVYMTSDAVDFSGKNASRPTKQNIESELQSLAGKDLDILFVYYGTHGFENKLLHEGCDLEEENEYWDVNDFITQLVVPAAQPVARKIFLVIEACYVEGMAIANVDMKDLKPLKADTLFAITTGTGLVKPGFLDIFQENLNTSKSYDSDDLAHLIKKEIPNRIRKQKPKVISSTKKKFKVIDKKPYVQIKQEEHGEDAFPQDVAVKASLQFQGYDDLVLGQLPITEPKKVNDSFIKEHGVLRLEPIAWRDPAGRQFKATDVYKTHSIDFTLWPGVNEISLDSRHLPKKLKSITGEIKDQYREPVSGAKDVLSGL
nr:caspase family protein [Deltaproteobacteria bacterium]